MGVRNFDGVDDEIDCGSDATIDDMFADGGASTCFFWAFPDNLGEANIGTIWNKGVTNRGGVFLLIATSKIRLINYRSTTDGEWRQTSDDMNFDAWNSIGMKYDSGSTTNNPTFCHDETLQRVDAGLDEITTPVGTNSTEAADDLIIGNFFTGTTTWDGYIAEVTFWKGTLLGDNQLQALCRGVNPFFISQTKPSLYMPAFGDQSPEPDYSGNNNDGTLLDTTKVDTHSPTELLENYL